MRCFLVFVVISIFGNSLEKAIIGFICCYVSYQLYGWGLYIGRLLEGGKLNSNLVQYRECELIDDLLYSCRVSFKGKTVWLYEYPKLFGFCGVTLTGLIITFLWGLYFGNLSLMLSGLAMGVCYWLGGLLEKLKALGKSGWDWGEWLFGAYLGGALAVCLIKKYKFHLIAVAAVVLAAVSILKPEYAENVARAFMLLIAGM